MSSLEKKKETKGAAPIHLKKEKSDTQSKTTEDSSGALVS
jgi:hypothetical protein